MQHGGRTRVDFHPLGQGRDVCDDEYASEGAL